MLAAPTRRRAIHRVAAHGLAGAIENGKVLYIALCLKDFERLRADFERFTASKGMLIIIVRFQERAG